MVLQRVPMAVFTALHARTKTPWWDTHAQSRNVRNRRAEKVWFRAFSRAAC